MFKKMLPWMIMILIAITLIALAAFVLWEFIMKDAKADPNAHANNIEVKQLSAKQIQEQTLLIEEITTNLAERRFVVRISFAFLLSSSDTKEELESLRHLVEASIIRTLADTSPDDIVGSAGMDRLSASLINQINPMLSTGKVVQIDITNFIVNEQR